MRIQAIFSANLRKYRKAAKLTQEKLAEMCDTDQRYIGQIETGTRCPSLDFVEKIAFALKIEPYLLFVEGNFLGNDKVLALNIEQKQLLKAILYENFSKICTIIEENN